MKYAEVYRKVVPHEDMIKHFVISTLRDVRKDAADPDLMPEIREGCHTLSIDPDVAEATAKALQDDADLTPAQAEAVAIVIKDSWEAFEDMDYFDEMQLGDLNDAAVETGNED